MKQALFITGALLLSAMASSASEGSREGFIPITGGKVWYRIAGADKSGIPLLVLHGGPGAPHDYQEPLEGLADERPVVFYDQLGCGNSEKPDDPSLFTVERFVEELEQVRKTLKLEKVHLLGQSWGTMLASEYLLSKKPEGVQSLILSAPFLSSPRFEEDARKLIEDLPEKEKDIIKKCEESQDFSSPAYQEAMMAYYRRFVCRLDPWPECLNRTFEKMGHAVYEFMWGPSEFTVTGTLKGRDLVPRLKEIRVPALFTCGRFDESSPETTKWYQKNLPGSEMILFEEASHLHHLEKTAEYLKAVRSFLHRAESRVKE